MLERRKGEEVVWVVAGEWCSWGEASADQKLGRGARVREKDTPSLRKSGQNQTGATILEH